MAEFGDYTEGKRGKYCGKGNCRKDRRMKIDLGDGYTLEHTPKGFKIFHDRSEWLGVDNQNKIFSLLVYSVINFYSKVEDLKETVTKFDNALAAIEGSVADSSKRARE
jgi:hypothetical protein